MRMRLSGAGDVLRRAAICLAMVFGAGGAAARDQPAAQAPARPSAPLSLAVVAEGADTLAAFDAQDLRRLQRWPLSGTMAGEPQFSPDGRGIYVGTREGSIAAYRVDAAQPVAGVQAGERLAGIALSSDGRWLLAGLEAPQAVVIFDASLREVRRFSASTRDGKRSSPVGTVLHAPLRRSFIVTLRELGEVWEISYDEKAEDIYDGLVHDFRMGEGVPVRGFLNPRRSLLPEPLSSPSLDADQSQLLGNAGPGGPGGRAQVLNLDVRKRIALLDGVQAPQAAAAAAWASGNRSLLLMPRAGQPVVDIVDMRTPELLHSLPLPDGPARAARTHANSPFVWLDAPGGAGRRLTLIDKQSLRVARSLELPGRASAGPALRGDGCRVLVATREPAALLLAYDATSAVERGLAPLERPRGLWLAPGTAGAGTGC
jgi:hypothetical protein